jgi:hypothetical protein
MRSKKFSVKPALANSLTKKNVRSSPSILPSPPPKNSKEVPFPEERLPEVQVDFAGLEDGSLMETIEDPADPNQTLLAIFKRGRIRRWSQSLLYFMKERHDPVTGESLQPRQDALLATLWEIIHRESLLQYVRVGGKISLGTGTNEILLKAGERTSVTDKRVGGMVASMGFRSTQRTKNGWILWLDSSTRRRCHQSTATGM